MPLMSRAQYFRLWIVPCALAWSFGSAWGQSATGVGSIQGRVLDFETRQPLEAANVVLLATEMGGMARRGGQFVIANVPPGKYKIKASFVGHDPVTLDVQVEAGRASTVDFRLKRGIAGQVGTIFVRAPVKHIDPKSSTTSHSATGTQLLSLPVETVDAAVALNAGVVLQEGKLHVEGGRSNSTSYRIDGVSVDDPIGGDHLTISTLSLDDYQLLTGGLDAEYGNASSGILNYTTKAGGANFEGNLRFTTDNYGRADKTYTNSSRLSLGFGGPMPFEGLTYYFAGEAAFVDGEVPTSRRFQQHEYLHGLIKFTDRAQSDYKTQVRFDWKARRGVRFTTEMTLSRGSGFEYVHNWNATGYVARVLIFPEVRVNRFQPKFYAFSGASVTMYAGGWLDRAKHAVYIDHRVDPECLYCLLPVSDNEVVRAVRVTDVAGRGRDPERPLYVFTDQVLFDGFVNPISQWTPELGMSPADTNKSYYNAAEHTLGTTSTSRQLKWTLTHTLSRKTFYEVKLSRLSFDVLSTVGDKTPDQYSTAGKFFWIPGVGPVPLGTEDFYTDPSVPFFATAYDFPVYGRHNTKTYLLRSDITTQRWEDHKVRSGCILQYNDLDLADLSRPGRQRQFRDPYGFTRNVFHNFNPEGSFYVQDQWQHEGMVVNAGLRYDFFSPGSGVGIEVHNSGIRSDLQRWQTQWSPRLGFAFPITDRDAFHFHYGRYIQFPEKSVIFATQDVNSNGARTLGNPNLNAETSISYQAGLRHQFTNEISGQFALYNKDWYGLVSSIEVTDDSSGTQNIRFANKSYASSRGLEMGVEKSFSHGVAASVDYTYSFADGVASEADFGRQAQGLTHLPTGELPVDWDQRHTLNVQLTTARVGDWSATTVVQIGSGLPWTPAFRDAKRADPLLENSRRRPATHFVSVKAEKYFKLHGQRLRLFATGNNLLDELMVGRIAPPVAPGLRNARAAYTEYATETGRFGGAYLLDSDGDGQDEFFPVHDPRVYGPRRQFLLGLGFEF